MAANFWASSHNTRWQLEGGKEVFRSNSRDFKLFPKRKDIWTLRLYFVEYMHRLGKKLRFRQRVLATATVFFKRFYIRASFCEFDPRLVAPTMLFLAAKVEECSYNASAFMGPMRELAVLGEGPRCAYTKEDILMCEFYALEYLSFDLIVYHPYRPLIQYLAEMGLTDVCLQTTLAIVNDSYRTDLCLVYPPYMIAISAIYMACTFLDRNCSDWLAKLAIDREQVMAISLTLLDYYDALPLLKSQPVSELLAILDTVFGKKSTPAVSASPPPTSTSVPTTNPQAIASAVPTTSSVTGPNVVTTVAPAGVVMTSTVGAVQATNPNVTTTSGGVVVVATTAGPAMIPASAYPPQSNATTIPPPSVVVPPPPPPPLPSSSPTSMMLPTSQSSSVVMGSGNAAAVMTAQPPPPPQSSQPQRYPPQPMIDAPMYYAAPTHPAVPPPPPQPDPSSMNRYNPSMMPPTMQPTPAVAAVPASAAPVSHMPGMGAGLAAIRAQAAANNRSVNIVSYPSSSSSIPSSSSSIPVVSAAPNNVSGVSNKRKSREAPPPPPPHPAVPPPPPVQTTTTGYSISGYSSGGVPVYQTHYPPPPPPPPQPPPDLKRARR